MKEKAETGMYDERRHQIKPPHTNFAGKKITICKTVDKEAVHGRAGPTAVKVNQGESNGTQSYLHDEDYESLGASTAGGRKSGVMGRFGSFGEKEEGDQSLCTSNKLASPPYGVSDLSLLGTTSGQLTQPVQGIRIGGAADQTAEVDSKISDGKNAAQIERHGNLTNVMPSMQVEFK